MAKNTTATAPAPQMTETAAKATATVAGNPKRKPLVKLVTRNPAKEAEQKLTLLGTVRQQLAEVADAAREAEALQLQNAAGDTLNRTTELAAKAAIVLYQGQRDGTLSKDEVNAALLDAFGAKPKADGNPGKTPKGAGEAIRKRVVRMIDAHDYVANGNVSAFTKGLPKKEVEQLVSSVDSGGLSIWSAYDGLGKLRSKTKGETVHPAFDPKRVAALVEALGQDGAPNAIGDNAGLQAAHIALRDVLLELYGEPEGEEA